MPATAGLGDMDFGRSHLSGRKRAAPSSPFDDVMGRGADRVKRCVHDTATSNTVPLVSCLGAKISSIPVRGL